MVRATATSDGLAFVWEIHVQRRGSKQQSYHHLITVNRICGLWDAKPRTCPVITLTWFPSTRSSVVPAALPRWCYRVLVISAIRQSHDVRSLLHTGFCCSAFARRPRLIAQLGACQCFSEKRQWLQLWSRVYCMYDNGVLQCSREAFTF